ncbi:MAG: hypothetical protein ACOC80_03685 [Petrotogales bacterium]
MCISCFTSKAQGVLEITGPIDAFEGEDVVFLVTLDGEPIQARVTFGDLLLATNSSTGKVTFKMPSVPVGDKKYVISAFIPGGANTSYSILVKNRTGILKIELSTDYISEMEEFNVTIKDRDEPVMGANVWFNSAKYTTDSRGNVTLTAPDILVTTNYGISVNKTNHKSNSTMITIHEEGLGSKLMEFIYPSIVESGEKNIEVCVISKYGGLENTSIKTYYEDSIHSEYITNNEGKAYINAPSINNDNYFLLSVNKEGYSTHGAKEMKISLFTCDLDSDLEITLIPSEIYEGNLVTAGVIDNMGASVEDATIWKGSVELDESTDSEGIVEFIAPTVFIDREYYIYAIKKGYNFAEGKITIRDKSTYQHKLTIGIENVINESSVFHVSVKDENNYPLEEVKVLFNSKQKLTNKSGTVSFTAPNVTSDMFYRIESSKYGYLPASASIEVINLNETNGISSRKIQICTIPYVMENEEFTVTVRDKQGNLLSGARVTFMGTSQYTDFKGMVTFNAPDVNWDKIQDILVTKPNYESTSTEITIRNQEEFQFWYLIIAIIIILIIGFIAFFKYGYVV